MELRRIRKLLVANRGEIARRIVRTAHAMGIETVAVFSDADRDAPLVREAGEAVRLGPAPSSESYLRVDRLLDAARATGADAVHPGYGFLAENADFAAAVEAAGLVFVGPSPDSIRIMGSKREAKRIATEAGVPVVPGYDGADQRPEVLAREARTVGFPLLLKASAGGGGKGMQIVREEGALADAIESARRVAQAAFGDGTLLVERYVERPRHVEVQILGDAYGSLVHLFERECSVQRRHQKILEETPSTALDPALREAMGEAAVRLGRAIGYRNAGTVEFILDPDGRFYFLEVNTRLQVEHPVTELVTGLDLVREQLRLAEGEALGFGQEAVVARGAALEARLYAEDPEEGFLPQAGRLVDLTPPDHEGLRIDGGFEPGSEVPVHYDPLLAKVVTHGATRAEATRRMARALRALSVHGVRTNRELLVRVLEHPAYEAGALHTHFLEEHRDALFGRPRDVALERHAAVAATIASSLALPPANPSLPALPPGFSNSRLTPERVAYAVGDDRLEVAYRRAGPARFHGEVGGEPFDVEVVACAPRGPGLDLALEEGGRRRRVRVVRDGARTFVQTADGRALALREEPRFPDAAAAAHAAGCVAPMPGKVVAVRVAAGDAVAAGTVLVVLEAMKMEHGVAAPRDATVEAVHVAPGDQVAAEALLVTLSE